VHTKFHTACISQGSVWKCAETIGSHEPTSICQSVESQLEAAHSFVN
jgi:hypothetical protein